MPLAEQTRFDKGLYVAGPPEGAPVGTVRRGRGLHPVPTGSARSRFGSLLDRTLSAVHSLVRFAGARFQAASTVLYREGVSIQTGLDGDRLSFAEMPPTTGRNDWLFVAGGDALIKVENTGTVTQWGIDPPGALGAPSLIPQNTKTIDACDATAGWAVTNVGSFGNDTTIKTEGTGSLEGTVGIDVTGKLERTGLTLDLTTFGAIDSPDQDWIQLAIRFDMPWRLASIQLLFGNDAFYAAGWTREILVDDQVSKRRRRGKKRRGLGDVPGVTNNEEEFLLSAAPGAPFKVPAAELLGDDAAAPEDNVWAVLRIPKTSFSPVGEDPTWATIVSLSISLRTNARGASGTAMQFYVDEIQLVGGVGMQGTYQYRETFKNSETGHRSNGTADAITIEDVQRQGVTFSGAAAPTDTQVDTRELWRTVGNGVLFFLVKEQAIATTTWTDTHADFAGLHGTTTELLGSEELPDDNARPDDDWVDCTGPHAGRMWWATGVDGNVHYSPASRPEGLQGFVSPGSTQDPTQKLVRWDDQLFVFCTESVHAILGSDEPFLTRRIPGAVGTTAAHTVVATSAGIVYQAADGIRVFDGQVSRLVSFDSMGPLWRGEDAEGLTAFTGVVAAYGRDEYMISDGSQTLALNVATGAWRDVGFGCEALDFERDTGLMLASDGSRVLRLDIAGEFQDAATPIPFIFEPPHQIVNAGQEALIRYLILELNTGDEILTPTLIIDGVETTLPVISTASRALVELPVHREGRRAGIRLTGSLSDAQVEIVRVAWEVYLPQQAGAVPTKDAA